ncbi:MCE family protein [Tomitella biformata]|uniref:MCE family protein n=1 Tax=Tomitella biformata TaxID=630403 RepID=UPI000467D461|nr:MlaD family protein [Tomitella biformata]
MRKSSLKATTLKLGIFTVAMLLIFSGLVVVFSQYRTGSTQDYHAVFTDASGLKKGDKVRIAGVVVGSVTGIAITDNELATVDFNVDDTFPLRESTHMAVHFQDMVGNRFVELSEGSGDGKQLQKGSTIPVTQTEPALDLDVLLGGFKPLFRGLDPGQVNKLAASLLDVFQGQGTTLVNLLSSTSSFSNTLAERDQLIGEVVDNLNAVLGTMDANKAEFSTIIDNVQQVVGTLAQSRDAVVGGIDHINEATGTLASLLTDARPDLQTDIAELNRLMSILSTDETKGKLNWALETMPPAFRQLVRVGAYGSFFNFYICGLSFKVDGPGGNPLIIPFKNQTTGRCAPLDE